jgi:hypothetical protein
MATLVLLSLSLQKEKAVCEADRVRSRYASFSMTNWGVWMLRHAQHDKARIVDASLRFGIADQSGALFGSHLWKENHVANRVLTSDEHGQAVDADADASGRRHAILEGAQKVFVNRHGFIIAAFAQACLFFQSLSLVNRVIEFGVGVAEFFASNDELEAFDKSGFRAMLFGQRRHLNWIIDDEGRGNEVGLNALAENGINNFTAAIGGSWMHAKFFGNLTKFIFILAFNVFARKFFDRIGDGEAAIRRFQIHIMTVEMNLRGAIDSHGNAFKEYFNLLHHPDIIFVGDIELNLREFRIMKAPSALRCENPPPTHRRLQSRPQSAV